MAEKPLTDQEARVKIHDTYALAITIVAIVLGFFGMLGTGLSSCP